MGVAWRTEQLSRAPERDGRHKGPDGALAQPTPLPFPFEPHPRTPFCLQSPRCGLTLWVENVPLLHTTPRRARQWGSYNLTGLGFRV